MCKIALQTEFTHVTLLPAMAFLKDIFLMVFLPLLLVCDILLYALFLVGSCWHEDARRVECACAQTLLGILITMLWSRGATELLELSGLLFPGATHYITIPKIRLLQGVQKATEEEVLFLTPCTPLCFCKPRGNTLFWDEQSLKKE